MRKHTTQNLKHDICPDYGDEFKSILHVMKYHSTKIIYDTTGKLNSTIQQFLAFTQDSIATNACDWKIFFDHY